MRLPQLAALCLLSTALLAGPALTPVPDGPFRTEGSRILNRHGQPFLLRGTSLTPYRPSTAAREAASDATAGFGPHSATTLTAIRLRFNMNAVRIPLDERDTPSAAYLRGLGALLHRVNEIGLLAVLEASSPGTPEFWSAVAGHLRAQPNVMFAVNAQQAAAIRQAQAGQTIILTAGDFAGDNVIQQTASLHPATARPLLLTAWDFDFENAARCAAIPTDPAEATRQLRQRLAEFDAQGVSWTVAAFTPGKLVRELFLFDPTTIDDGWTCGSSTGAGIGRIIEAYMRGTQERGLFLISAGGNLDVARGGNATAYGPIMATRDATGNPAAPPLKLGGLRVNIIDARGVTRPAPLLWTSAGWGSLNLIIPAESALGQARMEVLRDDGSRAAVEFLVVDVSPAVYTHLSCVGVAMGRTLVAGRPPTTLGACRGLRCRVYDVPVARGARTLVELKSSGLRNLARLDDLIVTVAGVRVPVVKITPSVVEAGIDLLTIQIPEALRGTGETDVLCFWRDRVSNAVRLRIG